MVKSTLVVTAKSNSRSMSVIHWKEQILKSRETRFTIPEARLAAWSWTSHLNSLRFNFPICKIQMISNFIILLLRLALCDLVLVKIPT